MSEETLTIESPILSRNERLAGERHAFLQTERGTGPVFTDGGGNRDGDAREQTSRTCHHIDMAEGDGIERTGYERMLDDCLHGIAF